MIARTDCPAIFQYAFQPLLPSWRREPTDGGFCLTMYQDARVTLEEFDIHGAEREQSTFMMPTELREQYLQLIAGCEWLFGLPGEMELPAGKQARFISNIGLHGYPYLRVHDLPHQIHLPFLDPVGRGARRLCCLLEDISELFARYGIRLTVNEVEMDYRVLTPVNKTGMDANWMESVS